jgi:hypothetical protein
MPETRYFLSYNPTKEFIQKLYRLASDRSKLVLQYYGEQGGWHYSFTYSEDEKKQRDFLSSHLTEEITEKEMYEYIKESAKGHDK